MGYSMDIMNPTKEMKKSREDSFGVEIWAMGFYRDVMRPILDWDVGSLEWPEGEVPNETWELGWSDRLKHPDEKVQKYFRILHERKSRRSSDPGLAVGDKFGDPGGIVVPEECRVIVKHLEGLDLAEILPELEWEEKEAKERVADWLDFCRLAADHGGFELI